MNHAVYGKTMENLRNRNNVKPQVTKKTQKWTSKPSYMWEKVFDNDLVAMRKSKVTLTLNPFHATDLFLYPLKSSENQTFSDDFRGYRKKPVAWNGLTNQHMPRCVYQSWLRY